MTKKVLTWIIVPLMAAIFVLDIITVALSNKYCAEYGITDETGDGRYGTDRIHFLNTGNSDAVLVESDGHFAMIDAGEGNSNPRRKKAYRGYEEDVLRYLKKYAVKEDGKVHLDFILATHYHYDHVGSFHAIITDPDIIIGRAYFKEYDPSTDKAYEPERWGLQKIYDELIGDINEKGIELISDLPEAEFSFGAFTVRLLNTKTPEELDGKGENAASVGVKLTKGARTAFIAGDITRTCGLEQLLVDDIGDIDLLKIGHHGYYGSSSSPFLKKVKPDVAIVTNQLGKIYPNVKWNLTMVAHVPVFSTYNCNGIIASFTDKGEIILTQNSAA